MNHDSTPKQHSHDDAFTALAEQKRFNDMFLEHRKVFLWGVVNDESARDVVNRLLFLDAQSKKEITLMINSPGGVVTSGMVIHDCMQMIASPVSTVCMGLAASMGSILLSAGVKGQRSIWPSGRVMIHQPSIGGFLRGSASDLQIHAREIDKTKRLGAQLLAKNCGKTEEQVMTDFDRDYWMSAEESIKYGIVDRIESAIKWS